MKRTFVVFSILTAFATNAQQDPHYSLWYSSPSLLNAAATATMEQDISFFTNYRAQWLTALPTPLRTNSFSGEVKLGNEKLKSGWFGLGAHYTNDATGTTNVLSNMVSIPINYVWEGYERSFFSIGLKPGVINRGLRAGTQTWDNQWNGIAFDQSIPTNEIGGTKKTQFDIGAGAYFKKEWQNGSRYDIGFAANHLNAPDQGFKTLSFQTFRQFIFHTSGSIKMERYKFLLSPQLIAMFQGPHRSIIAGTSFDLVLQEGSRRTNFVPGKMISFGINYRLNDAIIASIMLKLNAFQVGLSYDALLNTNRVPTNTAGALEVFLKYSIFKDQGKRYIR